MHETLSSIRSSLVRWRDAAETAPKLVASAVRKGLLPIGLSTTSLLFREGLSDLHWKVLGDALARFLQGSGPLLTKVGQVLATRTDLLPPAVCYRLESLYAGQRPMSLRRLRRALDRAYPDGIPFERFEMKPIAVGSIAQVHRARLKRGRRVVVKILRPGVQRSIQRDVNAARVFVSLFFGLSLRYRESTQRFIERTLEDLREGFEIESNLVNEADALDAFRTRVAKNPRIYIPVCYRDLSSSDVLVLEELTGEPLSRLRPPNDGDEATARDAASVALHEILSQIFEDGRFHADPHAGNLLLLEDGRVGLIDLGLTGELSARDRKNIGRAVKAFLSSDTEASYRALLEFGRLPADFDHETFKADVREVFRKSGGGLAGRLSGSNETADESPSRLEELVNNLFRVAYGHHIYLPSSTTLLIKTLVTIEGVARTLDPDINVLVTAVPILLRSLTPKWLRWSHWRRPQP
jgi:ubiquinone biosynthesis protein